MANLLITNKRIRYVDRIRIKSNKYKSRTVVLDVDSAFIYCFYLYVIAISREIPIQ